jgi:hypothetical protein
VSTGSLRWAVKSSFQRYVQVIAHGTCTAIDGAELSDDGVFTFPLAEAGLSAGARLLSFSGTARFEAHHGFLEVTLSGLRLTLGEQGGELSIAGSGPDRVTIATLAPAAPVEERGRIHWTGLVPHLTEDGCQVFGAVYPAGTEFAPLEIGLG